MKTSFLSQFEKDIGKLWMQSVKDDIATVIEQVEQTDAIPAVVNLKKLRGLKAAYRIRIGVSIDGDTVAFTRVVYRRDIYKRFP